MTEPVDLDAIDDTIRDCLRLWLNSTKVRTTLGDCLKLIAELRAARELERRYRELYAEVWNLPPDEAAEAEIDNAETVAEVRRMNRRIMELERGLAAQTKEPQ